MTQLSLFLQILDYTGIALFAATGALAASRKQLDIVAFVFFATITALGGGTLRDILLDVPVFWVRHPLYLAIPLAMSVAVFFTAHLLESRYRVLLWADAVGLAAYAVVGAAKTLAVGASAADALALGILTATFGGVIRDVLAGEPSVILRGDLYITCAFAGALTFVLLALAGAPFWTGATAGFLVAFLVRAGTLVWGWTLPLYRPRPGRDSTKL
ncbi:MAG: trimeric intracellular cation channel family protein [Xanthobacteraceae bacterium]|nr:trimeric intracellular cation channel family protein [Xanthobacteraceae bacterium]QYK45024.1 MAG: trimeric intracellular cation channel family protein [Xanthobacteraceae bacterium]